LDYLLSDLITRCRLGSPLFVANAVAGPNTASTNFSRGTPSSASTRPLTKIAIIIRPQPPFPSTTDFILHRRPLISHGSRRPRSARHRRSATSQRTRTTPTSTPRPRILRRPLHRTPLHLLLPLALVTSPGSCPDLRPHRHNCHPPPLGTPLLLRPPRLLPSSESPARSGSNLPTWPTPSSLLRCRPPYLACPLSATSPTSSFLRFRTLPALGPACPAAAAEDDHPRRTVVPNSGDRSL
jgi:hypothetical protein